jgi:hypothetical protein
MRVARFGDHDEQREMRAGPMADLGVPWNCNVEPLTLNDNDHGFSGNRSKLQMVHVVEVGEDLVPSMRSHLLRVPEPSDQPLPRSVGRR